MKVVIQCAGDKRRDAGRLVASNGKTVEFVAHPELAPAETNRTHARPDDISDRGISWRQELLTYNKSPNSNPLNLLPAYQLYKNHTYRLLVDRFGSENVYILSAGWGLIPSGFLTPYYDITFSSGSNPYQHRRKKDQYNDFNMLPDKLSDQVVFIGGNDYLPLFWTLTKTINGQRHVFYNSKNEPHFAGCVFKRFPTNKRTNWHYDCAEALIEGKINL